MLNTGQCTDIAMLIWSGPSSFNHKYKQTIFYAVFVFTFTNNYLILMENKIF